MFYSQFILAKKGPLGTIWIAAHLERKLRKNQVADTDIAVSVDSILFPEMPIALRLSSHLLLGVVRIYSKKVNYLFDDCSEALLKVKQAFRSTAVDLPPEQTTAPYHSITMPETFDLDDFELPDADLQGNYVDQHISSKDQITLQDTMDGVVYSTSKFGLDERFGDDDASGLDLDEELMVDKAATPDLATGTSNSDGGPQASADANASDTLNQELEEYDGDNEPVDYAQAPCTPGVWEEPNLSNVQETSACDDHQEPENHTIAEFAVKENLENASLQQHNNQSESHEKSQPHVAETEHIVNDRGSTPFREPRLAETPIPVSNDSTNMGNLLNNNVSEVPPGYSNVSNVPPGFNNVGIMPSGRNNVSNVPPGYNIVGEVPPGFGIANENRENFREYQGNQNLGVQSANDYHENLVEHQGNHGNAFHRTVELESNAEKHNMISTPQHHPSLEPKETTIPAVFPHASMPSSEFPVLRPCVTFPNHETNAEGAYASEQVNRNFPAMHQAGISQIHEVRAENVIQREVQAENINSYTNAFPAPVIQREVHVENINSYANDLSAPEKRLSLPHWLSDVPNVPESTPIEKDITSGKKRTFTESSMTPHSLNLNESSGFHTTNMPSQSLNLDQSPGLFTTSTPAQSLNLNESSGFFTTNTTAQSQNLNQSSGFFNTNTTVQSQNLNQSSGFFTTNTTAQSQNLNQSSGFFTTNTPAQSQNLNQSTGFFTTNTTAQSQNLNQSSGFFTTNTPVQSQNLNQSSGFFTTNTTAQSQNLNQSSSPFTITTTGQPVMNDDDLLSSILVGRKSSILKLKPTPPVVTPSTKRRRATPKTSAIKRKVLMDDTMVLHGDTIRQQLVNTEDIRRLRKKAPCTRSEISMLEKQLWEDELFSAPIFTGVSIKLVSLHKQLYNLSKIIVSHDDVYLEGGEDPKSVSQNVEKDTQLEVGPNVTQEKADVAPFVQPIESPMARDNQTHDNNMVNLDYYGSQQPQMVATEHVAEPFNPEHDIFGDRNAMEIEPRSFPDNDIGVSVMPTEVEVEPPTTHADLVPSDTIDLSATMVEVQTNTSQQTNAPGVGLNEKTDLQSFDMDINSNKSIESAVASEVKTDVPPVTEMSEEKQDQDIGFRKDEEVVNEDAALASNVESNLQNSVYNGIFGDDFGTVGAYETEVNPALENVPLDERENPDHQVTFEATETKLEDIPASNKVDDDESTHPAVEHNTDFLNFDDGYDDDADAGGDYATDVETTRIIDNSGWSSRTKAVAKYLQIMFDKEGERGRNMVVVNDLLVGKTRKEASRMFFETLVLKTKDYIHAEQADAFGNINVFPRSKLLKSDF